MHQCWQSCLDRLARSFHTNCLTARVSQSEDGLRQLCMHYYQSVPFTTARWFTRMLCSKYPLRRLKHMKNKSATVRWVPMLAAMVPYMFLCKQKGISSGARIQQGQILMTAVPFEGLLLLCFLRVLVTFGTLSSKTADLVVAVRDFWSRKICVQHTLSHCSGHPQVLHLGFQHTL